MNVVATLRTVWARRAALPSTTVPAHILLVYVLWRYIWLELYRQIRSAGLRGTAIEVYRYYKKVR